MRATLFVLLFFQLILPRPAGGQHVSSARGVSVGAYTAMVNDLSALDWNPAGLIGVRDWEVSGLNYLRVGSNRTENGFVFQSSGITKRFLDVHSAAVRYSPALSLEFVVPSVIRFGEGRQDFTYDKRISYAERYGLGYAFRVSPMVTLGMSTRFLQERITDTEPYLLQDTIARIRSINYDADSWNVDFGLLWEVNPRWKAGMVAKNLFKITESEFPQNLRSHALRTVKILRAGVAHAVSPATWVGFDFDTERQVAAGYDWNISDNISFRQGFYFGGKNASTFLQALSAGLGFRYETARFDVSYLHFTDGRQLARPTLNDLLTQGVKDIGFNRYATNQLSLTVSVALGRTRPILARIEQVEIFEEVYPSTHHVHASRPLGKAVVRNISSTPIQARVGFYAARFMDRPTETKPYYIPANSSVEVPFTAIFNEAIMAVPTAILQAGEVFVQAAAASDYDDRVQTNLVIRGRNDWDGDVLSLRSFVTPQDPEVMRYTRSVLNRYRDSLASVPKELEKFRSAAWLFDDFASRLVYVGDPRLSKDRVQYPSETLSLRGGDCDDFTVAYATMLASIGVATAFVDVLPPEEPQNGHIYLMFDTELPAAKAGLLSSNPKRYVIRKNEYGVETVWIPIETTATREGFQKAWEVGARDYYENVEVGLGLVRGWVRVVDVVSPL